MSTAKVNLIAALALFVFVSLACGLGKNNTGDNRVTVFNTNKSSGDKPPTVAGEGDSDAPTGVEKTKPAAGKGNVQGKVLYNEKPVEGIEVTLCEKFSMVLGIQCSGKTFKTKTDADGVYVISNADPKLYEGIMAKVYNTNFYISPQQAIMKPQQFTVAADKTIYARDISLFKADLKITAPKGGSKVDANNVNITWNNYPDAEYYKVSVYPETSGATTRVSGERVDTASYTLDQTLENGKYRLKIEAFNPNDRKLAESSDEIKFTVTGGADPAATAN